jgi:hypothetical protein
MHLLSPHTHPPSLPPSIPPSNKVCNPVLESAKPVKPAMLVSIREFASVATAAVVFKTVSDCTYFSLSVIDQVRTWVGLFGGQAQSLAASLFVCSYFMSLDRSTLQLLASNTRVSATLLMSTVKLSSVNAGH